MRKIGVYEQVGVAMTCRSYQEYVDMFSRTDEILLMGPILDSGRERPPSQRRHQGG